MAPANPIYRVLYVVWATVEVLLFGGLMWGWGALVFILKEDGLFEELCLPLQDATNVSLFSDAYNITAESNTIKSCIARDEMFSLVFTVDSGLFNICAAIIGVFNYRFGTRNTRIIAFILFISGVLMIAFASKEIPWFIFPGLLFVGISGYVHLITNLQFAALLPNHTLLVAGLLNGASNSSSGFQQLVKLAWESGVSRRTSYITIAVVYCLTLVNTFLFLPKMFITSSTDSTDTTEVKANQVDVFQVETYDKNEQHKNADEKNENDRPSPVPAISQEKPTIRTCIFSAPYVSHLVWFCLLLLRYYFYVNTVNIYLEHILDQNTADVSYYTSVLTYTQMTGFLSATIAGTVYNRIKRHYKNCKTELRRTLMPNVAPLGLTTIFCVLLSILMVLEDEVFLYPNFIIFTVFRAFFFTAQLGFISSLYPPQLLGFLLGMMTMVSGVFGMLQYALFQWLEQSGFPAVNRLMLAVSALCFYHPLYQWWIVRRDDKTIQMSQA